MAPLRHHGVIRINPLTKVKAVVRRTSSEAESACRCADAARATSNDRNFVFKPPNYAFLPEQ
jgi:hypothetical protein